jgi:hypothetical protein
MAPVWITESVARPVIPARSAFVNETATVGAARADHANTRLPCRPIVADGAPSLRGCAPSRCGDPSPHRDGAPSNTDDAPSVRMNASSLKVRVPSHSDGAPCQSDGARTQSDVAPGLEDGTPSRWNDALTHPNV